MTFRSEEELRGYFTRLFGPTKRRSNIECRDDGPNTMVFQDGSYIEGERVRILYKDGEEVRRWIVTTRIALEEVEPYREQSQGTEG